MDAVTALVGLVAMAAVLGRRRTGGVPSAGVGGGAGPALAPIGVTVHAGWTWVTGAGAGLDVVVGGEAVDALARTGAAWVACGSMFDATGPRFLLSDSVTGTGNPSREPTRGATVCVAPSGVVTALLGGGPSGAVGCRVAVQGYPVLVWRGAAMGVADSQAERRVCLAVLGDGRVALVGGYGPMGALVAELVAGGAWAAVYLDGGRAAHLAPVEGAAVWEHTAAEVPRAWVTLRG